MNRMTQLLNLLNRYLLEEQGDVEQVSRRLMIEGYTPFEIDVAMEWQVSPEDMRLIEAGGAGSFRPVVRVFTGDEERLFDSSARGYVLESVFSGRLDPCQLEELIDRLRPLQVRDLDAGDLKTLLAAENAVSEEERELRTRFSSIH